ncbi:iron ABC transporter substrate-binding protein [Natrinema saccharevitans]|uniref:Iron ABC transporter substrate-binding protein n=1 Tax=Natrinema saccharevitans TaxID=301967 RepID=A0A1S8ASY0_9EURY|nr:extracellular solute-binding protein [Natrinema saccharevitans]OLZ39953.1 iron ABC transporter substrate-binding protein [Natrinema saccharevitans]
MNDEKDNRVVSRRRTLQVGSAFGAASLAGCLGFFDDDEQNAEIPSLSEFRGSGSLVEGRPAPGGTSIEDLPNLSGDLALYIGGGEGGIYYEFVEMLQEIYPDFEVHPTDNTSSSLAQTIVEEVDSGASQADVFWSIDASSLGFVAENDAYEPLSDDAVEAVGNSQFVGDDNAWAGVAGRARAVPYNTNELSESDVPNTVQDFPETGALQTMGWAPTYGAFKSFVTAMRLLRDDEVTRNWLSSMSEAGTERFSNEYAVSEAVANGSLSAGFANHYYAMRVKNSRPDAPIDLAFTEGDAGALINVAGALKVQGTQRGELVDNFVRHLLSSEAQEYFATISFAYPMIAGVEPVGGLPTIDELSPPDIDLADLADLEPTLELMDDAGVSG